MSRMNTEKLADAFRTMESEVTEVQSRVNALYCMCALTLFNTSYQMTDADRDAIIHLINQVQEGSDSLSAAWETGWEAAGGNPT